MKLWKSSIARLSHKKIHVDLQRVFDAVVSDWPFPQWQLQINRDGGVRTLERQIELKNMTPPRTKVLKSKHLTGDAIDICLYWDGTQNPIWDRLAYATVAGYIWSIAGSLGVSLRWGADWNRNWILKEEDNWEIDFVHWERI